MDETVVYTRDTLRDLIMAEEDIPKTMKALGLFYVNTISDEDVEMINSIAPVILEKLQTGEMEDVINILEEANVPKPLLGLLRIQMGLYANKIGDHQAE
jgi:hypothetical protein